ncbi:MAG: hypothetical protein HQL13_07260, partial [Candidatus Omnitrophica bacterium]|nr:hypothetical protein [Candidatus Omnitrophota bacterium]
VLNKIDRLEDKRRVSEMKRSVPLCMGISALHGENIQALCLMIEDVLSQGAQDVDVLLPKDRMDLVNLAYQNGLVQDVQFKTRGIHLKASLPLKVAGMIRLLAIDKSEELC